jgi:hypothetical protein
VGLISYGTDLLYSLVASAVYQAYGARHPRGPLWVLIPDQGPAPPLPSWLGLLAAVAGVALITSGASD